MNHRSRVEVQSTLHIDMIFHTQYANARRSFRCCRILHMHVVPDLFACFCFGTHVDLVRRRGVATRGERLPLTSDYDLSETIKVSLVTSLEGGSRPIHVHMRQGERANDAFDFLLFVIDLVQSAVLTQGNVVVLDNAPIHNRQAILLLLRTVLTAAGITLWFLPTYAPELNPCEFVFAQCKHFLRYHRDMNQPFWLEVCRGFAETTKQHIMNRYYKSIWKP